MHALPGHLRLNPGSGDAGEGSSRAGAHSGRRYEQEQMPSIDHILPRKRDGRFACPYADCYESFEKRSELQYVVSVYPSVCHANPSRRRHMKNHYKPIKCIHYKECKFRCAEPREMDRHMQAHLPKEQRTVYKCDKEGCTKSYTRPDKLAAHRKEKH